MRVDEVNAKIIRDLLADGRKDFAQIAKECHTTPNTIRKRFAKLQQTGVIVGATVQIDNEAFGYAAIVTILLNLESRDVEKAFKRVSQIPNVLAIRQYNSRYSIRLIARLQNMKELDRIKQTIRLCSSVNDIRTFFWLETRNNPENLSFGYTGGSLQTQEASTGRLQSSEEAKEPIEITALDRRIVDLLSENGRMSFRRLSRETGVSTYTVIRRCERLIQHKVIRVSIQINPEKLGYQLNLDFSIAFAFQKETAPIIDTLAKIPDVIVIIKTSGDYDLYVTAMIRDIEQQFRIQEEIAKLPNIARMETAARRIPKVWPNMQQAISTF